MSCASVALFRRDGTLSFKAPRRETAPEKTQARKAASRYWQAAISTPDVLVKVVVVRSRPGEVLVAEREAGSREWREFPISFDDALMHPHLALCLKEIGARPAAGSVPMPDVLEINGIMYRREI